MTFKDLQKLVQSNSNTKNNKEFERLRNKPFWIWNVEEHKKDDIKTKGDCCFNHIIGLPTKENKEKPLYDYEKIIFDSLSSSIIISNNVTTSPGNYNKHLWIKKATGLGITEFMLRFMAWLCLKDDKLTGSQMCIVTGPRIDLAITLIDRLKKLFADKLTFSNKETVIELNGVRIEAFPSHHLDSMRGLPNVSFILLDEADFFPPGQQQDARDVSERYIGKSNPYIVMVSTPNAPNGLFQNIEQEAENVCIYKRLFFDYTCGLDKIYTREEIEKAKQSPSFEREYNLKYLGLVGNLFIPDTIEKAEQLGLQYPLDITNFDDSCPKSLGIDPAFASVGSKFGIVVTEYRDEIIRVLYAKEFGNATTEGMLETIRQIRQRFMIFGDDFRIYVDAANPAFIRSLKLDIGEYVDYEKQLHEEATKGDINKLQCYMKVIPVSFNKYGSFMLGHMKDLVDRGKIAIHHNKQNENQNQNQFTSLLTQMKMANVINDQLDKSIHSLDLVDALRLNLLFYRLRSTSYE